MRRFWYKKTTRALVNILQGLFLCVAVIGAGTIWQLTEGNLSASEMSRTYENTGLFYRTILDIVRDKIDCAKGRELFETDGDTDLTKLVDIRQYASGMSDETSINYNTAYHIEDLLAFGNDGAGAMQEVLSRPGADLDQQLQEAGALESILPVSGVSLADFARVSGNPEAALTEYYRNLCDTSIDITARYARYESGMEAGDDPRSPSNVTYYVENVGMHTYYTNTGATSYLGAEQIIDENDDLIWIFASERRYNIMVSNPDRVYSDYAADMFSRNDFGAASEKVAVAADLSYPVGDELQQGYLLHMRRMPIILFSAVLTVVCILLTLAGLVIATVTDGRDRATAPVRPEYIDQLPTEIFIGVLVIAAIGWWTFSQRQIIPAMSVTGTRRLLARGLTACAEYWILLTGYLSIVRRWKRGVLLRNSVTYYVIWGTRQVYSARKSGQRLLILYILFIIANTAFTLTRGLPGLVMALVLNLSALLYLMRSVIGNENVKDGLEQISRGRLDYRINTKVLAGESKDMGEAVNEMGEGLSKAVDQMLQSERLKAELITNVSHDLKTPLTSIISYVDLLKRRNVQDEQAAAYIQILDQKTQRLKQLTDDLIEASKISSGNIELHPDHIVLQQFIRQAVGEYEDRLEERGIRLRLHMVSEPVSLYVDGARLWRIFENLLGNMIKYGRQDSTADLTVTSEQQAALISMTNLSQEKITSSASDLMERFGRGDQSRRSEGFGLGLSIAQSLTELMGGAFSIEVEEERFTVVMSFPA